MSLCSCGRPHRDALDAILDEMQLTTMLYDPSTSTPVRAALVWRAVVRKTSPQNARITSRNGALYFWTTERLAIVEDEEPK